MNRLILAFMVAVPLFGASKAETQLETERNAARAALATAQTDLAKANKDREAMAIAVARLTAQAQSNAHSADQQRTNAVDATNANAAEARQTASDAKDTAENATNAAKAAATTNYNQQIELMRVSQHNDFATYATLITTVGGFLTMLSGYLWKAYTDARDHRWIVESANRSELAAKAAYKEANTVNQKIASAGLRIADEIAAEPPRETSSAS